MLMNVRYKSFPAVKELSLVQHNICFRLFMCEFILQLNPVTSHRNCLITEHKDECKIQAFKGFCLYSPQCGNDYKR